MVDFAGFAVTKMKLKKREKLVSFEFPDEETATHFAQRIANACGGTVKVIDGAGSDVARAKRSICVLGR
jgi:hypothetical protein